MLWETDGGMVMPRSRISDQERRRKIWQKSGGLCAHCGRMVYGTNRTVDHFVPKSYGGGLDFRNLMPLCRSCNVKRSNCIVDPEEFYPYASESAVMQCMRYREQWLRERKNLNGSVWIR